MNPGDEPVPAEHYSGFTLVPALERVVASDGTVLFRCLLTATAEAEGAQRLAFERTLELSGAEAELTNQNRPGSMPSREQLDSRLLAIGFAYMRSLVDLVEGGAGAIARAATVQVSEVRTRLGMSQTALQTRER